MISAKPFEDVVAAFEATLGHPGTTFQRELAETKNYAELESLVQRSVGPSGLLQIARMDLGAVIRKDLGRESAKSFRFLIGNPLVMKEMVKHVPDAGSYAPVTVLVDERSDGVHLSYDPMVGFLAPYENQEALKVARALDAKVEALLRQVAV